MPKNTEHLLQTPKGMKDLQNDQLLQMQGFIEKAQEVAMYYGFEGINPPILESEELFRRGVGEGTDVVDKEMYELKTKGGDKLVMRPEFTASIMRAYVEHGMKAKPQPVMLYSYGPVFRHDKPQKGRYRQFHQFNLEMLGSNLPVNDAVIIQTAVTILKEVGAKDLVVEINSIGDEESRKAYEKALKAYYRKHVDALSATDRQRLKTNVLRILDSKDKKTVAVNEDAPESMSYLTNESQKHFKRVLEYLEELGIKYRINSSLVRGLDYYSDTVFEIVEQVPDPENEGQTKSLTICGGGRYNYLAEKLGHKKQVSAVGTAIGIERVLESAWCKDLAPRVVKKPKVYFIQIGADAKLKSLKIIEELRKAKIPVYQSLSKDKLSAQLAQAEKSEVPLVLIFGQREAIDGTVIIRNMKTRGQEIVKIEMMAETIKKMK